MAGDWSKGGTCSRRIGRPATGGWERCLQGSGVEVPRAVLGRDVASALKREVPLDAGDLAWVPPPRPTEAGDPWMGIDD